jgi:hypothetical protein
MRRILPSIVRAALLDEKTLVVKILQTGISALSGGGDIVS